MPARLARHTRDVAVIDLGFRGVVASSAPYQPPEASLIVFRRVGEDFNPPSLRAFYEGVRRDLGREDAVVLLTAVDLEERLAVEELEDPPGVVAVSLGLTPPTCPGRGVHEPLKPSTINVAVGVDVELERSGLMDLFRVAAEAKALAAVELLLRCRTRSPGTASDGLAVVARPGGPGGGAVTAGMSTRLGGPVAWSIYRLIVGLGARILGPLGLAENALGYSLEGLLDLAMEAYSRAPVPGVSVEEARRMVRGILARLLRDPNVASLVIAARDLDLRGAAGALPGVSAEEFARDPRGIVADELLAVALSLYAAGFKGLLAAYWVERLKESGAVGIEAPTFEDDVVSALVGSALSLLYDMLLGGSRG
ncbi:adenosylcobinamide amidohydrolase [Stetteria hydrogenophila]